MNIPLAPSEQIMWKGPIGPKPAESTDAEINRKYSRRELRIVTESNREQLPNFVEAFKRNEWMNLRPFYQRRPRWDKTRQSKLIESFIMNIPVPPLFVYESDLARYEVMDGQQRISAILDFYANHLELQGLEQWPELNGKTYERLPSEIKKGIDRRSISYIVLLKESAPSTEEEILLRQQVFERLNTGGIALSNQEIRNSIYQSLFSRLLDELSELELFRSAWKIPKHDPSVKRIPDELARNRYFSTMRDTEIVLRFFALRQADEYRAGMKSFLDRYMLRARRFTEEDVAFLRKVFLEALGLANGLYGEHLFRLWDAEHQRWSDTPQIALADAVMVSCAKHANQSATLLVKRDQIIEKTKELLASSQTGAFTGQKNTKADVQARITAFDEILSNAAGE